MTHFILKNLLQIFLSCCGLMQYMAIQHLTGKHNIELALACLRNPEKPGAFQWMHQCAYRFLESQMDLLCRRKSFLQHSTIKCPKLAKLFVWNVSIPPILLQDFKTVS